MSVQITIEVPDRLGRQLQKFKDRLPELLELGLREVTQDQPGTSQDEREIMSLLASQPKPEEVLAIHPSQALQARVTELLAQDKAGTLNRKGEAELERYLMLEHLVRLAKAHAFEQIRLRS